MNRKSYATGRAKFYNTITAPWKRTGILSLTDDEPLEGEVAEADVPVIVWCVALLTLAPRTSLAQYNTAEISGVVKDTQGAVLPGAVVWKFLRTPNVIAAMF